MADPVNFTRPAAERIARVVRHVEGGDRSGSPLDWDRPWDSLPSEQRLRLATFTGTWATGTYKTVTISGSTHTAKVFNWCNPVVGGQTGNTSAERYVIFGRVMGTNSAIEVQLQTTAATCVMSLGGVDLTKIAGYSSAAIQLLGHNTTGPCLQWYSITTCSTATAS